MTPISKHPVGRNILLVVLLAINASAARAESTPPRDVQSDTWVATDSLGRTLGPSNRLPRSDRFVGIFYFLVHGTRARHDTARGPFDRASNILDNSEILSRLDGNLGPDSSAYLESYSTPGNYWWGQPAVGYFLSDDPWVHRRNLRMLGEAGVDVILLDATNGVLYTDAEKALFQAFRDLTAQGIATPKIAYVLHVHMAKTVQKIYDRCYADPANRDLWFNWLGKPLILGDPDADPGQDHMSVSPKIRNFFTWRQSWAWTSPPDPPARGWFGDGHDKWPWLDDYPQGFGWHESHEKPEEMPVAIAGHPTTDLGRSFRGGRGHDGFEPPLDRQQLCADTPRGIYFTQQWRRALEVDPQFIFITGWNEWYATRFSQPPPYRTAVGNLHLPYFFVDEYNAEFSRDAMPMKGGFGDNYYLQMVDGIRRFKGARTPPAATDLHTIDPTGNFDQWTQLTPDYLNIAGDTAGRDWQGWGTMHYRVRSKRNNITLARVACDKQSISFYVKTAAPLSPPDGKTWMQLLIHTTQPVASWNGYDLLLNRTQPTANTASVERWNGQTWMPAGTAPMKTLANELMIVVPRRFAGIEPGHGTPIDFHWLDDVELPTDPVDFWYRGESAPDGRFNYRYVNIADGHPATMPIGVTPLTQELSATRRAVTTQPAASRPSTRPSAEPE